MFLNTAPIGTQTVYVVRINHAIVLEDGVSLGAGSEVMGDEVPSSWAASLRLKEMAPTTPTDAQITTAGLDIP